jgi:hypothetical protein
LAISGRAFVPDTFPSLANSVQRLIFIGFNNIFFGIDYFSMTASTASLTSSLHTRFWKNQSMPSFPTCTWFWENLGRTSSLMA